jgi:AraC-like DNA-binding protein
MESGRTTAKNSREEVRLTLPAAMPGLQLLHAHFHRQSFPRHSHEGYGVGMIEAGALGFFYRGENLIAPAGRINTVNPDEVHTGKAVAEPGWTYRMFYFSAGFLRRMSEAVAGRPVPLPFLTQGVIDDPELARLIRQTHILLGSQKAAQLEQDTQLLTLFARLLARHTYEPPAMVHPGAEPAAIRRVIDFLDVHCGEELRIDTLASVACLSPYHFIRVFARHTGLTPHAWLMQHRVRKAQQLLRQGQAIADTAAQTGFTDQSHLTKTFKRFLGYTPGQLRNCVQDACSRVG